MKFPQRVAEVQRRSRFEEIYRDNRGPVLAYLLRRTSNPDDATETLIVVNTRTYAYMGLKQVSLRAFTQTLNDGTYHFRKGEVLNLQAVLGAGIVQHPGQRR